MPKFVCINNKQNSSSIFLPDLKKGTDVPLVRYGTTGDKSLKDATPCEIVSRKNQQKISSNAFPYTNIQTTGNQTVAVFFVR